MKKIIVVAGPTCAGKTAMALSLAKRKNGEIISADSRQIYKYLDIGSNKEGKLKDRGVREIDGVLQHLTDIVLPDQSYSVADFIKDADEKIEQIIDRQKVPIVCGGTGLYIKGLLYGLNEMPKADEKLREKLKRLSKAQLYENLFKLDPQAAKSNFGNPQRLLRALEVNIISKKTMQEHFVKRDARYDFEIYNLCPDRKVLYEAINERCKKMIEGGMIEETQKILNMGYAKNCPALSAIGYQLIIEFLPYLSKSSAGVKTKKLQTLIDEFSKQTRRYAKRQITWFKTQCVKEK
ncbi:MAG: tRNA (adenosine(37)-N6)-dimethylallyltransferase MiaA [Elusimicrobiota bacterium]|jgi:tRNA dimethylallyltransferase|nr:tRNA (adenosine(37)-N6)-dimethylallyltransferase MiaA [Elusimicrobiota bacterium]